MCVYIHIEVHTQLLFDIEVHVPVGMHSSMWDQGYHTALYTTVLFITLQE